MTMPFYESDAAVEQYLLFHYGTPEQICPLMPEARGACGFPVRCVSEPMKFFSPAGKTRALDLGCAVGRSSFELGKYFDEVVGIDFSERFVMEAKRMRDKLGAAVRVPREGSLFDEVRLELPGDVKAGHVHFERGDACDLRADIGMFNLVLMANLIDRLPDPRKCLARLPELVASGGGLIITSPYTWLEEYTPREKWLMSAEENTLTVLRKILEPDFELVRAMDLPFLIREHRRKYQWSVAEGSVWRRK